MDKPLPNPIQNMSQLQLPMHAVVTNQKAKSHMQEQPFPDVLPFFNKVVSLKAWRFIKKRLQHRRFPVNIAKCSRAPFSWNTSGRLLLHMGQAENVSFRL